MQKVVFTLETFNKVQDYTVLRSPVERRPLKIRNVRTEDIQFVSDLRLATFTFDLTTQAFRDQDVQGRSNDAVEELFPEPGQFELSLLEVSETYLDHLSILLVIVWQLSHLPVLLF